MPKLLAALCLSWMVLWNPSPGSAQDARVLPDWIEADPFADGAHEDPLGIDRGDRLERVSPTTPEEELPPAVPVVRGEVLAAIAGVRETAHDVEVRLEHGLAIVDVEMRFASRARFAAELRYRLAVPADASLAFLEVCNARGCREGRVDPSSGPLGPYDDALRSPGAGAALPIGHAAITRDARGHAIWLRAAPVLPEGPAVRGRPEGAEALTVRLRYVASAPVRGGRARLALPARGHDSRAWPARVRVRSSQLRDGAVDAVDAVERPVERPAWQPMAISARLDRGGPPVELEAWATPCGEGRCARVRAVAAPRPARARDVILLLDASPSTAGPARGRMAPAVAAVLSSLPSQARVRVAAFAARAAPIVETPTEPAAVSLVEITRALERELGSATRFEAAWPLIEGWVRDANDPLILLLGDGGLTTGASEEAFRAARRAGAEIASLNVAGRPSTAGLRAAIEAADGLVVDAGDEADRAGRDHGMDPLRERVAPLFAPVVERSARVRVGGHAIELGRLRAGEERVWEGPLRGAARRASPPPEPIALAVRDRLERASARRARPLRLAALDADSLVTPPDATCRVSGTFRSTSAPLPLGAPLIAADTRRCDAPSVPEPSDGQEAERTAAVEAGAPARLRRQAEPATLPSRSLRTMLRRRLIPVARGCFRDDRAGRPSVQRRAVYRFTLADREVIASEVSGRIEPELRACLIRAVDELDVPPFSGTVRVSYPLFTRAHLPPPTIALDADVAEAVDGVAPDER